MWTSIPQVVVLESVSFGCAMPLFRLDSHSRMIAIAINIMRTWWKPRNGISPEDGVSCHSCCRGHVLLTLHANRKLEVRHCGCVSCLGRLERVLESLRPQRAGKACGGMHSGFGWRCRTQRMYEVRAIGEAPKMAAECVRC
jgi:hypothetical protein